MSAPILATKLYLPKSRHNLVHRPRLIERLNESPHRKLTLVSAPAGFGKTTLIIEWLDDLQRPASWYALDQTDNDPIQFSTYFVHALQRLYPGIGTNILAALQTPQPPALSDIFPQLINEIAASPGKGILVLDDFHVIELKQLLEAFAFLVDNQPEQLHIVLTTREDPPFSLARLRARGELLEIRARDLQFTRKEAQEYLTILMGFDLTIEQISALEERTEGWIAGLQLAAISLQGEDDRGEFIQAFSGSHRFILDYLTEEVFRHLPDNIRHFLLKTAILQRLSAPLCDALTGRHDSDQVLQQIEEMNLFLVRLDHERQWYRYHHLFAEVLCKHLNQQHPDEVPLLHARASNWYETRSLIPEAIYHAQQANDPKRHADLIEEYSIEAIMRGQIHRARQWIEALPVDVRSKRPRINMNHAWALYLSVENDPLPAILDQIEGATESTDILGQASALRAFLSYQNPGQMQEYAMHALDIVPEENVMVRGLVHMGLANVHSLLGEKDRAYDQFAKAAPLHWAAGNKVAATNALLDLVLLNLMLGHWDRTRQIIDDFLSLAEKTGASEEPAMGMAYIGLGWIFLHQNQPEEAISTIQRGLNLAEVGGYRAADSGLLPLAQVYILHNAPVEARKLLAQTSGMLVGLPGEFVMNMSVWIAHTYLLMGDIQQAEKMLQPQELQTNDYYQLTRARLTLQKALHHNDRDAHQEALSLLNDAIGDFETRGWNGYLMEAFNLRAIIHDALGDGQAALNDLRQALALAEPEGEIYAFVREGPVLQSLLERLPVDGFVQIVLAGFPEKRTASVVKLAHSELVEALSEREVEVLQWMTQGLTYNDIAERMFVSMNTVRYHVKGLYRKLGVSSRAEAIAEAHKLDLF